MNHLPPRFKPELVYRFVPYLKQVTEGKSEVTFKASDVSLSIESAKARVRDAAIALSKRYVLHKDIDPDTLTKVWPDYKVIDDQLYGSICICLRVAKPFSSLLGDNKIIKVTLRTEDNNFEERLLAFALLLGQYQLEGGVLIIGMLNPDLKARIEHNHNVFFRQDKPNEHIMT